MRRTNFVFFLWMTSCSFGRHDAYIIDYTFLEMRLTIAHVYSKVRAQLEPFIIDIDPSYTILQIKEKITQQTYVQSYDQFLSVDGRTLDDEHTISSYDFIKSGSKITLVVFPNVLREKYRIYVAIQGPNEEHKTIDLDIYYYDTVAQVKQTIFECTQIPTGKQRLIFAGKQLSDERIFSNYGVQKESTALLFTRD
ncbi:hypothetical protein I4U23_011068 [Adineta vaga]|nr:hypothetical protein I4U23_011068 [Adineta vaga]